MRPATNDIFSLEIKYTLEVQQKSLCQHVVFNETDLESPIFAKCTFCMMHY